jgi:hypothetical protein
MMIALIAATALVAGSLSAQGQTAVAVPPDTQSRPAAPAQPATLKVILTEGSADGSRSSMATTSISTDPGHLWVNPDSCSVGASSTAPSGAAVAWRVTGRIVDQQGSTYTVEIDAVRVGAPATPEATASPRRLTISLDERVPLDRAPVSGSCGSGDVRLEATVTSGGLTSISNRGGRGIGVGAGRGAVTMPPTGRAGGGGAGALMGGRPGSTTSSATSGTSSTSTTSVGTRPTVGGAAGRGSGRGAGAGAMSVPPGSVVTLRPANPPIDAELWLVYQPANSKEGGQVVPKTVPVGTPFAFSAVAVPTSQGPVNVEVSGAIYERLLNGVSDGLVVEIKRRIKGDGPPAVEYLGSSTQHLPMPAPTEVMSFPIPNGMTDATRITVAPGDERRAMLEQVAAALPPARLLQGNTFELRLRIKSR